MPKVGILAVNNTIFINIYILTQTTYTKGGQVSKNHDFL